MRIRPFHLIAILLVVGAIWGIKLMFFGEAGKEIFFPGLEDSRSCQTDSDCVAAQCCHPTGAVNRDNAPDCSEVFCTLQCEPNTLDCGQGEIRCINNRCEAIINE